jgi:tRNA A-37 threonylcarbamoyl transferase component Bud32/tetratricopeptide (TPR) repeat protein
MLLNPDQARKLADVLLEDEAGEEAAAPASRLGGRSFGNYQVLRLIGVGGMGEVYEANQDRTGRRVAIKVIRPELISADLYRRFEHEVRVLARLQHVGIAQVFEAGRVDTPGGSTPYFAMEYVEGRPLTTYAAEQKLSIRERLDLFLKVCDAVEHAHRKGVIHRDLKPGNILVDGGGQPRILDFGVARATDSDIAATTLHTDIGKLVGTLPYMSPEQVSGDPDALDTRSDVYSLGVVLYELLARRPPYEIRRGQVHEAARVIREEEPTRLGLLSKDFKGDLETLSRKALEKERGRRYQSVGDLSADVRRFLSNEPIAAHPPSAAYLLRRFAGRHRLTATLAAAAMLGLATSTVVAVLYADSAQRARTEAQGHAAQESRLRALSDRRLAEVTDAHSQTTKQKARAEALSDFFRSALLSVDPSIDARGDMSLRDFLHQTETELADQKDIEPAVRAEIEAAVGEAFRRLGDLRPAEEHLTGALQVLRVTEGENAPLTLATKNNLSLLYQKTKRPDEGLRLAKEVYEARRAGLGEKDPASLTSMNNLAVALGSVGERAQQEEMLREVIRLRTEVLGPDAEGTLLSRNSLATALFLDRRFEESISILDDVIRIGTTALGPTHHATAAARAKRVQNLSAEGNLTQAEADARALVNDLESALGPKAPRTLDAQANLSLVLLEARSWDRAIAVLRPLAQVRTEVLGPDHRDTITANANLCVALSGAKQLPEAEETCRQVIEKQRAQLGATNDRTLLSLNTLASILLDEKKLDEALAASNESVEGSEKSRTMRGREVGTLRGVRGRILASLQRYDEAETDFLAAERIFVEQNLPPQMIARVREDLAKLYDAWGKPDKAATYRPAAGAPGSK